MNTTALLTRSSSNGQSAGPGDESLATNPPAASGYPAHDWPMESQATRPMWRRWTFSTRRYLMVLFASHQEAQRAYRGLRDRIPERDLRVYGGEEIMNGYRPFAGSFLPAQAVGALNPNQDAMERYFENARAGGAALWVFAAANDDANRVVRILADYDYFFARYSGDRQTTELTVRERTPTPDPSTATPGVRPTDRIPSSGHPRAADRDLPEPQWRNTPFGRVCAMLFREATSRWLQERRLRRAWTQIHYGLGTLSVVLAAFAGFGGLLDRVGPGLTAAVALVAAVTAALVRFFNTAEKQKLHYGLAAEWHLLRHDIALLWETELARHDVGHDPGDWREPVEMLRARARDLRRRVTRSETHLRWDQTSANA